MGNIKKYNEFIGSRVNEGINESFTITLDQLPSIGDVVDKIHWREGERFAFIDFKGIKNIPISIVDSIETQPAVETAVEPVAEPIEN